MTDGPSTQFTPELDLARRVEPDVVAAVSRTDYDSIETWRNKQSAIPASLLFTPRFLLHRANSARTAASRLQNVPLHPDVFRPEQTIHGVAQWEYRREQESLRHAKQVLERVARSVAHYGYPMLSTGIEELVNELVTHPWNRHSTFPGDRNYGKELLDKMVEATKLEKWGAKYFRGSAKRYGKFVIQGIQDAIAEADQRIAALDTAIEERDAWEAEMTQSQRVLNAASDHTRNAEQHEAAADAVRDAWREILTANRADMPDAFRTSPLLILHAADMDDAALDTYIEQLASAARGDLDVATEQARVAIDGQTSPSGTFFR